MGQQQNISNKNIMIEKLPPSEGKIQSECYIWFHNTYPEHRGRLYAINNNSQNAIKGSFNKAMGVVKGVADMHFIMPKGRIAFLEFKAPGGKQSDAQWKWMKKVESLGHYYCIITSVIDFKAWVEKFLQME